MIYVNLVLHVFTISISLRLWFHNDAMSCSVLDLSRQLLAPNHQYNIYGTKYNALWLHECELSILVVCGLLLVVPVASAGCECIDVQEIVEFHHECSHMYSHMYPSAAGINVGDIVLVVLKILN